MNITFVSNYINHHQMPFCEEMVKLCGEEHHFTFIQTERIAEERIKMGWEENYPDYVRLSYTDEAADRECRQLIMDSEVVIFGGCEDEGFIQPRIEAGKLTFRYSERVYKEAQWKWISPRGLLKKNHDHTRHNDKPVYLLCAGAYVASDFGKFGAYKNKMYKWGYFPEIKQQDIDRLIANKGYFCNGEKVTYILWAGRFLDWKHPELAIEAARFLKDKNYKFHMDVIGNGSEEGNVKALYEKYELSDCVTLKGFMKPDEVRRHMEQADILLFTSDRNEGWGAVANEAMNSGCVLVADHMIGAVPYLVRNGQNGCIYNDKCLDELYKWLELLVDDSRLREKIGRNAYETVEKIWSPKNAAISFWELMGEKLKGENHDFEKRGAFDFAPCMREYPKSEAGIEDEIFGRKQPSLPKGFK